MNESFDKPYSSWTTYAARKLNLIVEYSKSWCSISRVVGRFRYRNESCSQFISKKCPICVNLRSKKDPYGVNQIHNTAI